jgi:hypothetical protein
MVCIARPQSRQTSDDADGGFANHGPHCGAQQEEYLLHDEPGDILRDVRAELGVIEFSELSGRIQLSGNYSFEVLIHTCLAKNGVALPEHPGRRRTHGASSSIAPFCAASPGA